MKGLFRITFVILMLTFSVSSVSCSKDDLIPETGQPTLPVNPGNNGDDNEEDNNDDNSMNNNIKITAGSVSFDATLESNAAATAFKALLPMTLNMSEMNGNEKYYYLSVSLPTTSSNPRTIQAGDLMLYGSSCIVLFYESFSTSYSYTRLGRVNNPSGLASALGSGNAMVTFE